MKGKRVTSLLYKVNAPQEVIASVRRHLGDYIPIDIEDHDEPPTLPSEYVPLWTPGLSSFEFKNAISFLKRRGVSRDDILRYQIGYCESGDFIGRIIIPSYDKDMNLNYFTSRSYWEHNMKYKNPPFSKNTIVFENMINWTLPVVIVEGVFDAITLRRNAIPILGKVLYPKIELSMMEHRPPSVYIMLDDDARFDAIKMEQKLSSHGLDVLVVPPNGKDASDMGFVNSWKSIRESTHITFDDVVSERIKNI